MIESFQTPPRVNFNANNPQHIEAFARMLFYGRQHPTLRFNFDPREHGNAFEMMVREFVRAKMPKNILEKLQAEFESETVS